MQPGRWDSIDLQRLERNSPKDTIEIGRKQGVEDLSKTVIVERYTPQPILEQGEHPPFLQAYPHLIAYVMSVQQCEDECFDPTPTGKDMRGMGWDHVVDDGSDVQLP